MTRPIKQPKPRASKKKSVSSRNAYVQAKEEKIAKGELLPRGKQKEPHPLGTLLDGFLSAVDDYREAVFLARRSEGP